MLLHKGFAVHTAEQEGAADGLILKRHKGANGTRLVLSRARDGALLALEDLASAESNDNAADAVPEASAPHDKQGSTSSSEKKVLSTASISQSSAEPLRIESTPRDHTLRVRSVSPSPVGSDLLIDLPGAPRSIATWAGAQAAQGDFHLFALYDAKLTHFCYRSGHLEQIADFVPPVSVSRGLRLECHDLDEDGIPELAPVWVEDIYSVDEGTESRVHAWVVELEPDGEMRVASADLEGYLALVDEQLYVQERGEHSTFASPVYRVEFGGEAYGRSSAPVTQAQHWVFNHAPWPDHDRVLIWNDDQRLVLATRSASGDKSASQSATGTLLADFGTYVGASIYVPLEKPEYRSGFSAQDKVMARKVHVPRRMLPLGDALYTLARGREAGLPLVGKPSGRDKLVQINVAHTGLQARFPFDPVDAFILDFDILEHQKGHQGAFLLLNEKQDGTGRAYLQVQEVD
jgi:hypothetical protein